MNQSRLAWLFLITAFITPLFAQPHKIDPANSHERLLCVVPMVGSGTPADPFRPMYAPLPGQASQDGIIAFAFQISDDGKHALVEFVANSQSAFSGILNSTNLSVRVFHKGTDTPANITTAFQQYKKNFNFSSFGVAVP
jgi:hypothetical protein